MSKIIQLGNIRQGSINFQNPQTGRIYSIYGIAPTLNTCQGGERQPKVVVGKSYEKKTDISFNS